MKIRCLFAQWAIWHFLKCQSCRVRFVGTFEALVRLANEEQPPVARRPV